MIAGILLAGGRGERVNSKVPKQFMKLGDKYLFEYPLESFRMSNIFEHIVLVVPKDWIDFVKVRTPSDIHVIVGGDTRSESVRNALDFLEKFKPDFVVIHDASRPFLKLSLLRRIVKSVLEKGAVTAALSCADTMVEFENFVYVDRERYVRIQTPQAFRFDIIKKAHEKRKNWRDDTQPVVECGFSVEFVKGDPFCFKVTYEEDIELARVIAYRWHMIFEEDASLSKNLLQR